MKIILMVLLFGLAIIAGITMSALDGFCNPPFCYNPLTNQLEATTNFITKVQTSNTTGISVTDGNRTFGVFLGTLADNSTGVSIGTSTNNGLKFFTNNTDKMLLDTTGNLIIDGGILINREPTIQRPSCTNPRRGAFWFNASASGDDQLWICSRNTTGGTAWRRIQINMTGSG